MSDFKFIFNAVSLRYFKTAFDIICEGAGHGLSGLRTGF